MRQSFLISILFLLVSTSAYPQSFLWGRMANGGFHSEGNAVAVDSSGYVYVAGVFQVGGAIEINFSGVRPAAFGGRDIFLAKYDNNGRLIWIRSGGSPDHEEGGSLCVDRSGNIYLAVVIAPGFYTFDTNRFDEVNRKRVFVAKYNPYGGLLWVADDTTAGGSGMPLITCGPENEIYLAMLRRERPEGIVIARYDTAGKEIWRQDIWAAEGGMIYCGDIAAAPDGGVGITGRMFRRTFFDTVELGGNDDPYPNNFIVRYNAEGRVAWGRNESHRAHPSTPCAIGFDTRGNSYVSGPDENASFISKYDTAGVQLWSRIYGGSMFDMVVMPWGALYLTGNDLDTKNLVVTAYTHTGMFGWRKDAPGNISAGYGITRDRNNNIFVTGIFGTDNVLPPTLYLDDIELNGDAAINMFVAKIGSTSDVEERNISAPFTNARLHHVAPNPSTGAATIRLEIGMPLSARLALYNARGEEIAVVMEKEIEGGYYDIPIDLHGLPNGVYILRLQAGSSSHAARILLAR